MSLLRMFGFACLLVVGACASTSSQATLTSAEVRPSSTADRVRLALAVARCDTSGASCAAASRDACIADQQRVVSREVDLHYCAPGIQQRDVDDCVAAIRNSPCTTRVRDLAECRADSLCQPWEEARP